MLSDAELEDMEEQRFRALERDRRVLNKRLMDAAAAVHGAQFALSAASGYNTDGDAELSTQQCDDLAHELDAGCR